jgi:hypothetical protein
MAITFTRQTVTTGTGATNLINANFQAIETALAGALSRNNTTPNSMLVDLDMNGKRILNLDAATSASEPVTYGQFQAAQGNLLYEDSIASSLVSYTSTGVGAVDNVEEGLSQTRAATVLGRTSPHANFSWFDSLFTVTKCSGPGEAKVAQDISDVFLQTFSATLSAGTRYVHPSGSDSNGGSSWSDAFLTVEYALRSSTGGSVFVAPGDYGLSDFRYTDTGTLGRSNLTC